MNSSLGYWHGCKQNLQTRSSGECGDTVSVMTRPLAAPPVSWRVVLDWIQEMQAARDDDNDLFVVR